MTARRNDMTERPGNVGGRPGLVEHEVDVLSEVLRAVRLSGAVYFNVSASTPWVAEAPDARELAPYVMPGSEHVIEYHVVMKGACWAGLIGEPGVYLEAGDIIVFPQGDAHVLASAEGMRGPVDVEFVRRSSRQRLPLRLEYGGSGRDPVQIVCGFLACDARPFNPLLTTLPRMLYMKKSGGGYSAMLEQFMSCAMAESRIPRAGGEVVLARLSELMFVEVVREYIASRDAIGRGWLSGLRDEIVGRALAALHARPAHGWTLESLAHAVGASRSALAARFVAYVGLPPMQYLAHWRMQLAATLLAGPSTLASIAEEVGYGSEAAFSRAFKKIVGVAPARWRTARAGGARSARRP
ncbi:MAG TPA: AraC family transcriptional regulator [Polyangiaceae bacterium]|jgi:AraC-like DNA-binding protein|nr:AraC family transcriptional regulator [Polyangiaceae bacterium]